MVTDFHSKLEPRLREIEAKSHIKIHAAYRETASHYSGWCFAYAVLFAVAAFGISYRYTQNMWSQWALVVPTLTTLLVFFSVSWLMHRGFYFSFMIPRHERHEAAFLEVSHTFLNEGLTRAHSDLGILVAVFHKEKMVIVLADHGFDGHVAADYWSKLGATLAKDFNSKRPGDEFFAAFEHLETEVAPKFKK